MNYDNTNKGVLFRAKSQETDKHPTHSGSINVDGKEFWLAAWVKESKSGEKFFSLAVKPKDAPKEAKPAPKGHFDDFKSDIPF